MFFSLLLIVKIHAKTDDTPKLVKRSTIFLSPCIEFSLTLFNLILHFFDNAAISNQKDADDQSASTS